MKALDLRLAAPRSPRAELAGIVFLPRSIDKVRATLPGGNIGEYSIQGFTTMMLEKLGIGVAELTTAVAEASSDEDVAAYIGTHARAGGADEWNAFALHREIFNGDRAAAIAEIPWLADHPEIRMSLDLLAEDDRRSFAPKAVA
jgi:hypothetical protein